MTDFLNYLNGSFQRPEELMRADKITAIMNSKAPAPQPTGDDLLAGIRSAPMPLPQQQPAGVEDFKQAIDAGVPQARELDRHVKNYAKTPQEYDDAVNFVLQHPEDVDPGNSYQTNKILAQWAKQRSKSLSPQQYLSEALFRLVQTGKPVSYNQLEEERISGLVDAQSKAALAEQRASGGSGNAEFERNIARISELSSKTSRTPQEDNELSLLKTRVETLSRGGMSPLERKMYAKDPITREIVPQPGLVSTTQQVAGGEELSKDISKGIAEQFTAKREAALDAEETLYANAAAREVLDKGVITGYGADFLVNMGRALSQSGVDLAEDPVANTQAFLAMRAQQVGRIIKLFGSGTGLSDADRDYAEKAAAGQINLDEKAIRKIIQISDRQAKWAINRYEREASKVPSAAKPYDIGIQYPKKQAPVSLEVDYTEYFK
jgi:hypothetical protein